MSSGKISLSLIVDWANFKKWLGRYKEDLIKIFTLFSNEFNNKKYSFRDFSYMIYRRTSLTTI